MFKYDLQTFSAEFYAGGREGGRDISAIQWSLFSFKFISVCSVLCFCLYYKCGK